MSVCLVKAKNYEEMSRMAANYMAAQINLKPDTVLGLATGTSPIGLYDEMARRCAAGEVDFSRVRTVNLDEYFGLEPSHEQSYRYFMNKHLFSRVNIKPENTHLPQGNAPDGNNECVRYDKLIAQLGGIDFQLLGLGHNGHIGFNEPADAFTKGTNFIQLTERTIEANSRLFNSANEVPRSALTMGVGTIMAAKRIMVVVNGKDKAETVRDVFKGPVTPKVAGSILQFHPDVMVFGDEDAFSLL